MLQGVVDVNCRKFSYLCYESGLFAALLLRLIEQRSERPESVIPGFELTLRSCHNILKRLFISRTVSRGLCVERRIASQATVLAEQHVMPAPGFEQSFIRCDAGGQTECSLRGSRPSAIRCENE